MASAGVRPVIYVAGPMTGYPGYNYPAFERAAAHLRAQGWTVISPHENGLPFGLDYEAYMRADAALFAQAGAICLLPGWVYSTGANRELGWARERGLPVYFLCGDACGIRLMAQGPETPVPPGSEITDL